ncbi:hypothetical protein [Streptomyces sp. CB01881]|uniref:hypothetical protein n=1 Tax=Streptomyces sp. CB01881 TaxID=2078691 RepID=UPI000CDC9284|nr:hypothetical protein [Streptomyces sp. CB01881]AUY48318.1 hypothetical protein C2142_04335 [Streptomyces sp. CB01881]TYC76805.1 hypothetical protein EH183_04345 [Streptomyces sp. CB01881]
MTTLPDLDRLLKAAGPLPADRPRYDLEAGQRRIAEKLAALAPQTPPTAPTTVHADARRDLRTLATVVINEPDAYETIDRLVDGWEPNGALVFGCLLDLAGRQYSATWWWQFAAGAGSHLAAYCLYLHHLRMGEPHDAEHWFQQAPPASKMAPSPPSPPNCPTCPATPTSPPASPRPCPTPPAFPAPTAHCARRSTTCPARTETAAC